MSITITEERPDSPDAVLLIRELDETLAADDYPPESRHGYPVDKLVREGVAFWVARVDGAPAACGGLKLFGAEYGEVKRMYVRPAFRGKGLAKSLLRRLEEYARERGVACLRLETGITRTDAIALYEGFGFRRCGPFGGYRDDPLSVYLEKGVG